MCEAVEACDLDLTARTVITEGATGAYASTPVLAALAGASEVIAVTRSTRYGTVAEVRACIEGLAGLAGVSGRIEVVEQLTPDHLAAADVITNSGHVRPIDASLIKMLKPDAVVPLMFEAWELGARNSDVDVTELRRRGIRVAGTNERHPNVDVFSYLGPLAIAALHSAGVSVYRSRIRVVCDNDFGDFLRTGLERAGAQVTLSPLLALRDEAARPDAVVVALTPRDGDVLTARDANAISVLWPDCVVVQYWGDIDRAAFAERSVEVWPRTQPSRGHMAALLADIGPEAVIRLQCGGLKVAELLLRPDGTLSPVDRTYIDEL